MIRTFSRAVALILFALLGWKFRPGFDSLMNDAQHLFAFLASQGKSRGSHPLRAQPAFLDRQLDILHKFYMRVQMEQRREPLIKFPRLLPLSCPRQFPEVLVLPR